MATIETAGEGGFAQVDIDDKYLFIGKTDACSQIAGGKCFAGSRHERCEQESLGLSRLAAEKIDFGTQVTEGFSNALMFFVGDDDVAFFGVVKGRDVAEEGYCDRGLNVGIALDLGVEEAAQDVVYYWQKESDDDTDEGDVGSVG